MSFKVIQLSIFCLLALQKKAFGDNEKKELPGPLETGMAVKIIGRTWWLGAQFSINLQSTKDWSATETSAPFHMRVKYYDDKVVFAAWEKGIGGEEGEWVGEEVVNGVPERYRTSHLAHNNGLGVLITAEEHHFEIYMNGRRYTYDYPMVMMKHDFKDVKYLVLTGDYTIDSITWQRKIGEKEWKPY